MCNTTHYLKVKKWKIRIRKIITKKFIWKNLPSKREEKCKINSLNMKKKTSTTSVLKQEQRIPEFVI